MIDTHFAGHEVLQERLEYTIECRPEYVFRGKLRFNSGEVRRDDALFGD